MTSAAEEARQQGRRGQFKATIRREVEAQRRRDALATQQSQSRASRVDAVRRIAMEALLGGDNQNDVEQEVEIEEEDGDDDGDTMADVQGEDASMDGVGRKGRADARRRLRRLHRTLFFARQFQIPDWMLEPPDDLLDNWLVQVRPEGERCLLLSEGGQVEVRRKNGYVHERFQDSRLPKGLTILDVVCIQGEEPAAGSEAASGEQPDAEAVEMEADAVEMDAAGGEAEVLPKVKLCRFHASPNGCKNGDSCGYAHGEHELGQPRPQVWGQEAEDMAVEGADGRGRGRGRGGYGGRGGGGKGDGKGKGRGGKGQRARPGRPQGDRKYMVCDALVWGDTDMAGADAEFRMFWLASRFAELPEKHSRRARELALVPTVPATPDVLLEAYKDDAGYVKDSLLFLHREGHYAVDEPVTPLALNWRDGQVSKYVVDTEFKDGQVVMAEKHLVCLELRGGGRLRTADRALVAQLGEQEMAQVAELLKGKGGKSVGHLLRCEVGAVDVIGRKLAGVKPVAHVAARSRVWPDSWGRIVFQHLHRQRGPALNAISFEAVMQGAASGGAGAPMT